MKVASPSEALAKGVAMSIKPVPMVTATMTGRFMTHATTVPQKRRARASPECTACLRQVSALIRLPRTARTAGTAATDKIAALATAAIAPKPNDRITA